MNKKTFLWIAACLLLGCWSPAWAVAAPDLTITSGSPAVTPSTLPRGTTITLPSWTLSNQGTVTATNFQVAFYLSTDTVITTEDIYLGYEFIWALAGGSASVREQRELNVSLNTAPGTYYVGILVDTVNSVAESNEANNTAVSQQITITAPGPDLTITSGALAVTPGSVQAGGTVTLPSWTLSNQGDPAAGFDIGFFLSTDAVITADDTYLGMESHFMGLWGRSDSVRSSKTLTIPTNTATGTYYVGILVDYTNRVAESNENNNTVLSQQITVTGVPQVTVSTQGLSVTVSWTPVPGATAYTLCYLPYPWQPWMTMDHIGYIAMGRATTVSFYLWEGAAYYVAVQADTGQGQGNFSNIEYFILGPPNPEWMDNDGDGYHENSGDCDDASLSVGPHGVELCGDGIDQDCNGHDLACTR